MKGKRLGGMMSAVVDTLYAADYYPTLLPIEGPSTEPEVTIGGKEYTNFASNSYLGIGSHPDIIRAVHASVEKYGVASGASRLTAGTQTPHCELEEAIAAFKGTEDAVVFTAGALVNIGSLVALMNSPLRQLTNSLDSRTVGAFGTGEIFMDKLNHASLVDGAMLATSPLGGGNVKHTTYRHGNMTSLRKKLAQSTADSKLIVTDGIFSLHGHIAPLPEIAALAEEFDASLYVDDSHGTGVFGENGRGTAEMLGIEKKVDMHMGTFSKALAGSGGFIAGSRDLCRYLRVAARTYMFQTAMPPYQAAAHTAALRVVQEEPWRRERLAENAAYLRSELTASGFDIMNTETQIIPILIGKESLVKQVERNLMQNGIFAPCYYYPAVEKGKAIVRVNVLATHTKAQLDHLLDVLSSAVPSSAAAGFRLAA